MDKIAMKKKVNNHIRKFPFNTYYKADMKPLLEIVTEQQLEETTFLCILEEMNEYVRKRTRYLNTFLLFQLQKDLTSLSSKHLPLY